MEGLVVEVHDAPTPRMAREYELEEPETLLGFYTGVPLTERSIESPPDWPEKILIFQRAIEEFCQSRDEIVQEVRITVMHEIGHHFGMDEDDLEELGYE
jgi:predicted Zn-dependent protease with MMP-like domain